MRDEITRARAKTPVTVVHVLWSLVAGGMETYVVRLAAHLDANRYRPVLCPLDKGGALESEVRRLAIPYQIMRRRSGMDFRLMVRLYRLFRAMDAGIVHTHHFNGLFHAAVAARLAGALVVHTEHAVADLERSRIRLASRALMRLCDHVVGVGPSVTQVLADLGIPCARLATIPAGVDNAEFTMSKAAARAELGIAARHRVAIIVARLFPEKNHVALLRVFRTVVDGLPDARLLVVGDGIEEHAVRETVEHLGLSAEVRLLGVRHDVPRLLAAADVFVLPSLREGLPISILEAMTAGLPVIATRVADVPTVVKEDETGVLVPPNDERALAAALTRLLTDSEHASRLGANAKLASEAFSVSAMADAYQAIYERSLTRKADRS